MADTDAPQKVVVDCSVSAGLAATVPLILQQAQVAAAAGDVDETSKLLDLARQRAEEAATLPAIETIVLLTDEEIADKEALAAAHVVEQQAAAAVAWVALRMKRDRWLAQTDVFFVEPMPSDFPAGQITAINDNLDVWKTFRQALRDLPSNTKDPFRPSWPTAPAAPQVYLT